MQKILVAILFFSLFFKGTLSYCARVIDPLTVTLDQFLNDITFEIVPYPTYPTYPSYPGTCAPCQYALPYPTNPYCDLYQCGYPECSCYPMEFEMTIPPCPTCLDFPCGWDAYPTCSCYRDLRDPCIICDNDPMCICLDCGNSAPSPYIYFPQVEYPMSAKDIRPYYYGNCWCT